MGTFAMSHKLMRSCARFKIAQPEDRRSAAIGPRAAPVLVYIIIAPVHAAVYTSFARRDITT